MSNYQGVVGRNHPSTSKEAAKHVDAGTQRDAILVILKEHGPMNCAEITPFLNDALGRTGTAYPIPRNQTATRMGELRDRGLVTYLLDDDGEVVERPTTGRNTGKVWTLVYQPKPRLRLVHVMA